MNELKRNFLASAELQLLIAEMKLQVCKDSTHNIRRLHIGMLEVEIDALKIIIKKYDNK